MPEWIEEAYIVDGNEHLLKRIHLQYDSWGNVDQEDIYDGDNTLRHSLFKEYNERGHVISETNALGFNRTYSYDDHGRIKSETNYSSSLTRAYTYDLKGRPAQVEDKDAEGAIDRTSTYHYDHFDRITYKSDHFGQTTHYAYKPFCHDACRIDHPPMLEESSSIPVQTQIDFDELGRKISVTDPNGKTTQYAYNAYGYPTEIFYADGGRESYRYTLSGRLHVHTDADGLTTTYSYDPLGRVEKIEKSHSDTSLTTQTREYQGALLVRSTDEIGDVTTYAYDGASRKIREEKEGRVKTFTYDSLGNLSSIKQENGSHPRITSYTYDLLGHNLETRICDAAGTVLKKTLYTYDAEGNVKEIKKEIGTNECVESFSYDALNRIICLKDGAGYHTTTQYDERYINADGQNVLKKTVTLPDDTCTTEIDDVYGRVVSKTTFDQKGNKISSETFSRDPCGNTIFNICEVYEGIEPVGTKTTTFAYDALHRLKSHVRADGTSYARTTALTYTPQGRLKTKTKPDGLTLTYEYDSLGYLKELSSSDQSLRQTFVYDAIGQLRSSKDHQGGIRFERKYDPFGNITLETHSNGSMIEKVYDQLDRPLCVILPDKSKIAYTYDSLYCRRIDRITPDGDIAFSHTYEAYDLSSRLTSEILPGALGKASYKYDPNGRYASQEALGFNETCKYDPVGNLVTRTQNGIAEKFTYDPLRQITSEELLNDSRQYLHDSTSNRVRNGEERWTFNPLDESESAGDMTFVYDLNGNMIEQELDDATVLYTYDTLNRLIQCERNNTRVSLIYDALGRKVGKTLFTKMGDTWKETSIETYFYDGKEEIGSLDTAGGIKQLRILGIPKRVVPSTIAIELAGNAYAAVQDFQGNIRRLVKMKGKPDALDYLYTSFGECLECPEAPFNPWQYASKRYDPDLGLIDFGHRYYHPAIGRWLTTDPAGFVDGMNLYTYLKNNPFCYLDPDGCMAFAPAIYLPVVAGEFALGATISATLFPIVASTLVAGVLAYGAYQGIKYIESQAYSDSMYSEATEEEEIVRKPPYSGDKLGDDPTVSPGEGFEWRGKGDPTSGKGSWYNPTTGESLHPDFNHPEPINPHWDYASPESSNDARLYLDGTWEFK